MIKLVNLPACAVVVACLAVPVFASEPRVVGWDDLAPEPVEYDNPFEQLTPEQLDGLRKLLRLRQAGGSNGNTEESVALRARLEADGR